MVDESIYCLINDVLHKKAKYNKTCPSQLPKAHGKIFRLLVLSNQRYFGKTNQQISTFENLEPVTLCLKQFKAKNATTKMK